MNTLGWLALLASTSFPGAQETPFYRARNQWSLPSAPVDALRMEALEGPQRVLLATEDGNLSLLEGGPGRPQAPRPVLRVEGIPRDLFAVEGRLFVVVDRPPALHEVRIGKEGARIRQTRRLPFAPRAAAGRAQQGRIEILVVGGRSDAIELRLRGEAFEEERFELDGTLPHAVTPAIDPDGTAVWVVACTGSCELVLVGREGAVLLEGLPRALSRSQTPTDVWVCAGTPAGGDVVQRYRLGARGLQLGETLTSPGPVTFDLVEGDWSGDGRADLSVLNLGHHQLALWASDERGSRRPVHTVYAGQHPEQLLLADVDGNGFDDWVILQPEVRAVSVLYNENGREQLPRRISTPRTPTAIVRDEHPERDGLFIVCEGEPGVLHLRGEKRTWIPAPGRSLVDPVIDAETGVLRVYDLVHRRVLFVDPREDPRLRDGNVEPAARPVVLPDALQVHVESGPLTAPFLRGADLFALDLREEPAHERHIARFSSPPSRIRAARWKDRTWIFAACPQSHTVEYVCLETRSGPHQIGAGLAPRDLVLVESRGQPPEIYVANAFSHDVLHITPR